MTLETLSIRNFKGISDLHINFNGQDAAIYGDNATGKTSVYDAFLWLLFGKDSTGRKDFEVKPLDANGKPKYHGVEVTVDAAIAHNGQRRTLRRVYAEKWTRKRGEAAETLTGHETTYYVDDVPMGQAQYQGIINAMIPENIFKILTNPYYFSTQMKWQDRRTILFELCGQLTDAQIIDTTAELEPLSAHIGSYTIDEYRKVLAANHKNINTEMNILPARLDEAARMVCSDIDPDAVAAEIARLEALRDTLQASMQKPNTAQLDAEITRIDAEISSWNAKKAARDAEQRTAYEEQRRARLQALYAQIDAVPAVSMREIGLMQQHTHDLETEIASCRAEWNRVNGSAWAGDTVCPTCGRPFPDADIAKAQEAFNLAKAEKLAAITQHGKELSERLTAMQTQSTELTAQALDADEKRQTLEQQITATKREACVIASMPEYDLAVETLRSTRKGLAEQIIAARAGATQNNSGTLAAIAKVDSDIQAQRALNARYMQGRQAAARVQELQQQQKELARQIETVEQQQYLCERFARIKAQMVQERVNAHFALARFKLFEEQINGGLADACEIMVDGVPYSDLNHAMQINAGLDVINTLAGFYGVDCPVFVDNAESIVTLGAADCQIIRLVVSAIDATLRIEVMEGDHELDCEEKAC